MFQPNFLKSGVEMNGYQLLSPEASCMMYTYVLTWPLPAVQCLFSNNFDGFDMDWEFPATRGSPPDDKYRFSLLMKVRMDVAVLYLFKSYHNGR